MFEANIERASILLRMLAIVERQLHLLLCDTDDKEPGVYLHKHSNLWEVRLVRQNKNVHLGYFTSKMMAIDVCRKYKLAERKLKETK